MSTTIVIKEPQWPLFAVVVLMLVGTPVLSIYHLSKVGRDKEPPRAALWSRGLTCLLAIAFVLWIAFSFAGQEGALRVTLGADAAVFEYRFSSATVGYSEVTHLEYRDRRGRRGARHPTVTVTTATGTQRAWGSSGYPEEVAAVREAFDRLSARVPKDRITVVVEP